MIKALDGQAVEIEMRRHAARPVIGLQHFHPISLLLGMVSDGKAHRAGTDDNDPFHAG